VALRDLVTKISTESILANDGGLRPRALGDEGGNVALPGDVDAVLRGLVSERRSRCAAGVAGTLLLPPSPSCPERRECGA
jgi:hypothetical protein